MSCRDCVNRREFLANGAGLAALTAAIAACGDGTITGGNPPRPGRELVITVGDFPQLATMGTLVAVGESIAVKRTGTAAFDALYMVCTHAGCLTVIASAARVGQQFDCPCHGSRFDANGAVLNGPANRPLTKLVTSYDPVTDELTIN